MNYKKSFYNMELETLSNGDVLLFNSLSSAFGILDSSTKDVYYNIENIEENSITSEEVKKNIEIMKSNRFLVDNDLDEIKLIETQGRLVRYSNDSLTLTIAPTIACNMACPYCYEVKKSKRMDEETIIALVTFVEKTIRTQKIKKLSITWYGGEPLLEKNIIKRLSKEFLDICMKNDTKYSADIVTNGALLDYDTAKMLKEDCRVDFAQITIDGLEEIHNKRRVLKNGKNSFKIVTDNIDACKDIINISIRVNVDKKNMSGLQTLISYFIDEKKWINKVNYYFAPVDNSTDACQANLKTCYTPLEFGQLNSELLREIYRKGDFKNIKSLYPKSACISCGGITRNFYVVDPQGYLYKCWDTVGIIENNVGNVKTGVKLNAENLRWLSLDAPEECKQCKSLPICQSGCPSIRLKNGNKPICSYTTVSFKENLKLTYEEYVKNKALKESV